jgi:hypothetical protein
LRRLSQISGESNTFKQFKINQGFARYFEREFKTNPMRKKREKKKYNVSFIDKRIV